MEYNNKRTKLEQYKEKLKERNNDYDLYFLDKFSNGKMDKTLNLKNNSLKNQENQILNNNEFNWTSRRNVTPNPNNLNNYNNNNFNNNNSYYNNNNNNIQQQNFNQNQNRTRNSQYNINSNIDYMNFDIDNNNNINANINANINNILNNNINNIGNNTNNNSVLQSNNNNLRQINGSNQTNNINMYSRPRTHNQVQNNNLNRNNNLEQSTDPYGNNYQGTGIIPREKPNTLKEEQLNQNKMLKEIWAAEMQEKKIREEKEKQRQKELDFLEDEKIRKEIEEEELKVKQEKLKKKQDEEKIMKENEQLLQNRKNEVENGNNEIDLVQNINTNNNGNDNQLIDTNNDTYNYNNYNFDKQKYKNIDLNNIQFYRKKNNNDNINQKMLYRNKIKNNSYNNRRVNEFEFAPNPKQMDDSKNPQIAKLKKEINSGYMEISSLFKQLKNNVIEANQVKNKAQNELKYITDEINKEKKYRLKLEKQKYDKMKQEEMYNNYYVSVRDVDPVYHIDGAKNFQPNNEMSNLAKAGQNSIGLKAESIFIPIGSNNYDNNIRIEDNEGLNTGIDDPRNNIAINEEILNNNNLEIESESIFKKTGEENF